MALTDARRLSERATLRADVCIAGAGAAGISLALRLRGSGLRVLLLEGGDLEITRQAQALYEGEMTGIKTWSLTQKRARAFGGTTHFWSGWCMPLAAEDFEARDYVPHSGWPIAFQDLAPYLPDAGTLLEIGPGGWDAGAVAAAGLTANASGSTLLGVRLFRFSPRTQFGQRYRPAIEQASDIDGYYNANVTEIVLTPDRRRVASLSGRVLGGGRFTVEAGRYVLCLGGIENARLLLASRGASPTGVANSAGLVGRYFMEHPHYYGVAGWLAPPDSTWPSPGEREGQAGSLPATGGIVGLTAAARRKERLLDCLLSIDEGDGTLTPEPKYFPSSVSPADVAALTPGKEKPVFRRITIRAEQSAMADSRVTLSDAVDAFGVPRIRLDWRVAESDLESYGRTLDLVGRELGALGLGRIWWPADPARRLNWSTSSGGHHMGTTRMGSSSADGVVDGNGRTFDVENLYIAGSSVFRTGGSANPTLPIVALALRLADHLKRSR
jgi:choline dehydrogenase-like flavoprotein